MKARLLAVGAAACLALGCGGDDGGPTDDTAAPGPGPSTPTDDNTKPGDDTSTPSTPSTPDQPDDTTNPGRPSASAPVITVQLEDGSPAVGALVAFRQGEADATTHEVDERGQVTLEDFDLKGGACDLTVYLEGHLTISFAQLPTLSFNQIAGQPITMDPLTSAAEAPTVNVSGTHARKDQEFGMLFVSASTGATEAFETDDWSIAVDADTPFTLFAFDLDPDVDQQAVEGIEWFRVDHEAVSADTVIDSLGEAIPEARFEVGVPVVGADHPLAGGGAAAFLFTQGPNEDWFLQLSGAVDVPAEPVDGVLTYGLSRPENLDGLGKPFMLYQWSKQDSEAVSLVAVPGFGAANPSSLVIPSPPQVEVNGSQLTWQDDSANAQMIVETWISDGPGASPTWILVGLDHTKISLPALPTGVTLEKMTPAGTPTGLVRLCGLSDSEDLTFGCARMAMSEPFSLVQ